MRLPPDDPAIPFVEYLCERNADCVRLIGICDRAILMDAEAYAVVNEIRAALKLAPKPEPTPAEARG